MSLEKQDSKINKFQYQKILLIQTIINTIKNNPKIKSDLLIAKLTVEPPYFNERKAFSYIQNLEKVGRININEDDEVILNVETKTRRK